MLRPTGVAVRFILKLTAFAIVWQILQTTIDLSRAYSSMAACSVEGPQVVDLRTFDDQIHRCGPLTQWVARDVFDVCWADAPAATRPARPPVTDDPVEIAETPDIPPDCQALSYPFAQGDGVLRCDASPSSKPATNIVIAGR